MQDPLEYVEWLPQSPALTVEGVYIVCRGLESQGVRMEGHCRVVVEDGDWSFCALGAAGDLV